MRGATRTCKYLGVRVVGCGVVVSVCVLMRVCHLWSVNRGADVTRLDSQGHTPRDVIKSGHPELLDILTAEVYLEQDAQVRVCVRVCVCQLTRQQAEDDADEYADE